MNQNLQETTSIFLLWIFPLYVATFKQHLYVYISELVGIIMKSLTIVCCWQKGYWTKGSTRFLLVQLICFTVVTCHRVFEPEQEDGCYWWGRNCLPFGGTWGHPKFLVGFQCCSICSFCPISYIHVLTYRSSCSICIYSRIQVSYTISIANDIHVV